jgi:hypothetical protein
MRGCHGVCLVVLPALIGCGGNPTSAVAARPLSSVFVGPVASTAAPTPEDLQPRAVSLTPWEQCSIESGHLRCRRRGEVAKRNKLAWTLPASAGATWRPAWNEPEPAVRHFDGGPAGGCAALVDGTVRCWAGDRIPMPVPGAEKIRFVSYGGSHACGIAEDGSLWCWGKNDAGQLGSAGSSGTRARQADGGTVAHVATRWGRTCASVKPRGNVVCWGNPLWDENGRKPGAMEVPSLTGVEEIALGETFACARRGDGSVACFGRLDPDAPIGTSKNSASTPVVVAEVSDATALAAGSGHACALRTGGAVSCWGADSAGQLGNGHRSQRAGAHPVVELSDAVAISAAGSATCALRTNGEIHCWGFDEQFRGLTGKDRPRRATRVSPEPDLLPAAQASPDCPYGPPIEISTSSWKQELTSAGEDEDQRARVLAELGLPAVPSDREPYREEDREPYQLGFAEIVSNVALTASGSHDLVVQVSYRSKGGTGVAFRAVVLRQIDATHVCPALARPMVEEDLSTFDCAADSLGLTKKPLRHYTADRLLEQDRGLLMEEEVSGGCGVRGWGVTWKRSFRPLEGGKLATPVLTLESMASSSFDGSEGLTEIDTTYSLAGGWPKQVVVKTDTTTCVPNADNNCARKTRTTTRATWEFKDGKYQPPGKAGKGKKTR